MVSSLWLLCFHLSCPSLWGPSLICHTEAVQFVPSSCSSGIIVLCVGTYFVCLWEKVHSGSSYTAILGLTYFLFLSTSMFFIISFLRIKTFLLNSFYITFNSVVLTLIVNNRKCTEILFPKESQFGSVFSVYIFNSNSIVSQRILLRLGTSYLPI